MQSICKTFGGTQALLNADFSVEKGEIHALLGENGAGKSTLMNILSGVIACDSGTVVFADKSYISPTIRQMENAGIAFVHQERNLANDLCVYENLFLNRELTVGPLLNKKAMIDHTKKLFAELDVQIDATALVSELKTSEKQLLEICRALDIDAKLFIMDEPTTALSDDEVEHLFRILRRLKEQKKSIIFISHKMGEIFDIADRYTVLRNGETISSGNIKNVTPHAVTSDMVGEQYVDRDDYQKRPLGDVILSLKGFTGVDFRNINLEVRKGEIIAFTGLAGCGASELLQTMFGAMPSLGGTMEVEGKRCDNQIYDAMKMGVAMLPSNRKENSIVPNINILENTYIAEHVLSGRKLFIHKKSELKKFFDYKDMLKIKTEAPLEPIESLSGGNQQKVFLARWLNIGAEIMLFDNPTQGVDVGAKVEIYRLILEFAAQGKTVILNTLEIPEIKKVSDRCAIFYEGEIVKILDHNDINEHDVMLYATNVINERKGDRT